MSSEEKDVVLGMRAVDGLIVDHPIPLGLIIPLISIFLAIWISSMTCVIMWGS